MNHIMCPRSAHEAGISRLGLFISVAASIGFSQVITGCGSYYFSPVPVTPAANLSSSSGSGSGGRNGGAGNGGAVLPACTQTTSTPATSTLPANVTAAQIAAICPAIGNDSECGAVIIIGSSGETIYYTGQGPYDGREDTLVGVLNQSGSPVSSIDLSSNLDIMNFDNDGITTYTITGTTTTVGGNSMDSSGYGGPNAYYTNISNSNDAGTVNFITQVAANGGTTYFSLENALQATSSCLATAVH